MLRQKPYIDSCPDPEPATHHSPLTTHSPPLPTLFIIGFPGGMGGANTECWHTARLWRSAGWGVEFVPTIDPPADWVEKLQAIGCRVHGSLAHRSSAALAEVPGLAGGVVVSMCNAHFWPLVPALRKIGCRLVWVNCMTTLFQSERHALAQHGPCDAYVFQSEFQRQCLEPELAAHGYTPDRGHLVRGAFFPDETPYAPTPHAPRSPFVIGRLSRPARDKWSNNHWAILGSVPYLGTRALCMGWNERIEQKLGPPPPWAECLAPQSVSTQIFLGKCHALVGLNGGARENWPRVGLEAMAAGVPIVAQNLWGWREMVAHGVTGFLADGDAEMCYYLARLAYDEDLRQSMAEAGRRRVEQLADPAAILAGWSRLIDTVQARESRESSELELSHSCHSRDSRAP